MLSIRLLAQTVSARGREIGIRMSLGASWRNVMQLALSRGIVLTGAGVVIGVARRYRHDCSPV
jgi:ABC-type lipoprotein release transport system permease subunit